MVVTQLVKKLASYVFLFIVMLTIPHLIKINPVHISNYVLTSSLILRCADKIDSINKTDIFEKYPFLISVGTWSNLS